MFPDSDHLVSTFAECTSDNIVAFAVINEFLCPVFPVVPRGCITFRTTVPEAPIDENSELLTHEDEIGVPKHSFAVPAPTGDISRAEQLEEPQFSCPVLLAAYLTH